MDNNDFDKRMELLKKSYERIPSSFDPEDVLRKIEEETNHSGEREPSSKKMGTFRRKMTVWAVGIASMFLFGVLATNLVLGGQGNTPASGGKEYVVPPAVVQEYEAYIEALKKDYNLEREKRRKMLRLEEEKFDKLEFVNYADSLVSSAANKSYQESMMSITNGKERLKEHFDNAVGYLKLPSEMAKDIMREPLVDDEQASIAFLGSYRDKIQSLITVYDEILAENLEAVNSYRLEPSNDNAEAMMQIRNQLPQVLQQVVDTMQEQSIELYTNRNMEEIEAHYYASALHKDLQQHLHQNTLGYVEMLVQEPYTFGGTLQYSVQELVPMLREMEQTLLIVEEDSALYPIMESHYIIAFNTLMQQAQSKDKQGSVQEDFRWALKALVDGDEVTPLNYLVGPIVKELEASGWRESKSWDVLDYNDIQDMLVLARAGRL